MKIYDLEVSLKELDEIPMKMKSIQSALEHIKKKVPLNIFNILHVLIWNFQYDIFKDTSFRVYLTDPV